MTKSGVLQSVESCNQVVRESLAVMLGGWTGEGELRPVALRDIFELERAIFGCSAVVSQATLDAITTHHFAPGVYLREMVIPKGMILTGAIHKTRHLNICSAGDISVLTTEGVRRIKAPCVIMSEAGCKRAGFAHENTVWTCIHENPANETDVGKLWDALYHNEPPERN
jgi:hypothetical protein